MSYSMRVYVRTLAVAAICLFTIYASCFLCFAEDVPAGETPGTETSDTVEDVSPEESEIPEQSDAEPPPEDREPEESTIGDASEPEPGESSSEENPAGGGGIGAGSESDVEPNNGDADSVDTGGDVYSVAEDVHAIRQYAEFFLFGIIPLSCAFGLVIAGCIWFRKVFIRM